jgi:predicted Fe-Mo cluster-binding NifX family protein
MSFKVAVASSDGKYVNQHFGKARSFLIFEVKDDGKYEFLELRKTAPRCGGSVDLKEKTLDMLSDCDILLVSQIGPGAATRLTARGVEPLIMPMFIEDALKELWDIRKDK